MPSKSRKGAVPTAGLEEATAKLRHIKSGKAVVLDECLMGPAPAGSGTWLCSLFFSAMNEVVFGDRYDLEVDGQSFVVIPIEGQSGEERIQILAIVTERLPAQ